MVDCADFLAGYSDYRDGLLAAGDVAEYDGHAAVCSSCARYDRAVRQGGDLLRGLPELQPSEDFMPRLQHRVFHLEEEMRHPPRRVPRAGALMFVAAGIVAAATAFPGLDSEPALPELPPIAARAPQPAAEVPVLFRRGPLLTPPAPAAAHPPAAGSLLFQYTTFGSGPFSSDRVRTVSHP